MNKILEAVWVLLLTVTPVFAIMRDDFVMSSLPADTEKPQVFTEYNYLNTDVVQVSLLISEEIKSEKDLYEGQIINFTTAEDVRYNNKVLVKKDTPVTARVETIISNGMNGIPASVVLGSFNIPGLEAGKINLSYEKYGKDLSLLVFPIKWILTPLPPTGSLTNFIKGGHVKITSQKPIAIYYHPKWNE